MRTTPNRPLDVGQELQHPEQIGRAVRGGVTFQCRTQRIRESLGLPTENPLEEGAERLSRPTDELGEVGPTVHESGDKWEHVLGALRRYQVEELDVLLLADEPQSITHPFRGDRSFPKGKRLVEQGEGITHAAVCHSGNEKERVLFSLDPLLLCHISQPFHDRVGAETPKVEPLEATHHRCRRVRNFLRLRRGKDEYDSGRRFLQDLEERVPRFAGKHVGFVDDVDLGAIRGAGGVGRSFTKITGVIDAPVARRIDLHDIEVGRAGPDTPAGVAGSAGLAIFAGIRTALTIEGHGQDACSRGLTDPPGTREEIRVRHPVL